MHTIAIPEFAKVRGSAMFPEKCIDPAKTAVIAVDFQRFFIDDGQPMGNPHARDIIENANRINAAVRETGGLVVLTQHSTAEPGNAVETDRLVRDEQSLLPGSPSYDLHPDLICADTDMLVVKYRSSPLHPKANTGLQEALEEADIDTLIVTGLASNGCCDCLARDAFQHGYDVIFASDASAAMSDEEHNATLLNLGLYYARIKDTDEIVSALSSSARAV